MIKNCDKCNYFFTKENWGAWESDYHLCLNPSLGDPDGYEISIENLQDGKWIIPDWCPLTK